jgi:transposase
VLDIRLLVDHRERLVATRTRLINDLRWNLHDLWPELEIPPRGLIAVRWPQRVAGRLARAEQTTRVRVARDELRRIRDLTKTIDELERELALLVAKVAPRLLAERGCGVLISAKIVGEVAGVTRFATDAKLARLAGSAPIPASSGHTIRHRLDRGGNRQLNCALHRHHRQNRRACAANAATAPTPRTWLRCGPGSRRPAPLGRRADEPRLRDAYERPAQLDRNRRAAR